MRFGDCANATTSSWWCREEIEGLVTSTERDPIEANAK